MKKSLTIILVIILLLTTTLALVGCKQAFNAKNVREQIESNLGWHQGGNETCVYDVFDGDVNVGTYASKMSYVYNETVTLSTSIEEQNRTLESFSGYKFETEIIATSIDGISYEKYSVSYTDLNLAPLLSYSKETTDTIVEIVASYDTKRINTTFICDGAVSSDSVKYKSGTMTYDNAYVYQFARTTDLASTLSISVPTYSIENQKVSKSNYAISYLADMTAPIDTQFVLDRQFVASGEQSESTFGVADEKNPVKEETDEEGNVKVTYPYTQTSSIPSYKCTFTSANSSLVRGSISCYIAVNSLKMPGSDRFASRVVVMMQEGKMTYKLKSISYSVASVK